MRRTYGLPVFQTAELSAPTFVCTGIDSRRLFQHHRSSVVMMDMAPLHELLADSPRLRRPEAVAEGSGWSVFLPGTPIAADGADLDEAAGEFVAALREYAEDWIERLRFAPNHAQHWPLVHLVSLISDADLIGWVRADG